MGIYQNGFKRPLKYKVSTLDQGDITYSVLQAFSYYDSITVDEYLLMSTDMAKQRMLEFIQYINETEYNGYNIPISESFFTEFDIEDNVLCENTIPDPDDPDDILRQTVNLSSSIVNENDMNVTIRWKATVENGLALQDIPVPIVIRNYSNSQNTYHVLKILKNTESVYIDITYEKKQSSYLVRATINTIGNLIIFTVGVNTTSQNIGNAILDPFIENYTSENILHGLKLMFFISGEAETDYKFQIEYSNHQYGVNYELFEDTESNLLSDGTWSTEGITSEFSFTTNSLGDRTFILNLVCNEPPMGYSDNCATIKFNLYKADNIVLNPLQYEIINVCYSYEP